MKYPRTMFLEEAPGVGEWEVEWKDYADKLSYAEASAAN